MAFTVFCTKIPYSLIWGKGGWLALRLEGKDYDIAFERVWHDGSEMEMKYDRLGRISHTKLAVRFPYATTSDSVAELRKISHKAINRMLDVYRIATKEFYVGHIPMHELGAATISHGVYDIEDDGSIWERNSFQYDLGPGINLPRTQAISDHAVMDMEYDRPLPIVDLLVLNARRSLLFEDYRVAVIEADTAFEVGVDRILTRHYLSKTSRSKEGYGVHAYSKEDVNKKLDAGLKNLLEHHLHKAIRKGFFGTEEHSRWEKDLYELRNAVVHDGKDVQPDEAERAVEAAEDALVWIGAVKPHQWPATDRLNQGPALDVQE